MTDLKKHTKKYTSRNSPPYSAKDFRSGTTKRGNDGGTYVVSSPSTNGVKRWVKKVKKQSSRKTSETRKTSQNKSRKTSKKTSKTSRKVPLPSMHIILDDDTDLSFEYHLTKPKGRWIRFETRDLKFRRRRGCKPLNNETVRALLKQGYQVWLIPRRRKPIPASETKATKPRGEGETITRKSDYDNVSVTFKPYYRKPSGNNGWIFWVINRKEFREPHHGAGSGIVSNDSAKFLVANGYKVYVVKEVPDRWS